MVRFTDHIDRILPTRDDLDLLWNSNDISEVLPTGSIHRYIYLNSYNRFNLKAKVIDWLPSDDTELHYSFDESGLNTEIAAAAYPALEALDHEGYDFSVHDQDGDMNIDSLVVSCIDDLRINIEQFAPHRVRRSVPTFWIQR